VSLRLRLTLTYSVLVALILGIFGAVLYASLRQNLEAEMDRRLQIRASQVELTIWPGTRSLTPDDLTAAKLDLSPLADLDAPNIYVQVLDRGGQVIATSDSLRGAALPVDDDGFAAALAGRRALSDVVENDRAIRILSVPITVGTNVVGVLEVGQSREPLQDTMRGLRDLLLLLGAGALLIAGLLGWLVAHRGLRALQTISAEAATIAARRDFGRRLHLDCRPDEIGQLARTIDTLLDTVEDTLRTHREFVADTSHELRNPLLAIRTNIELLDRLTDREERAECRREAREQIERMSRLVADLLLLARVEAGELVERRPIQLNALLQRVAGEAAERAIGPRVQLDAPEPIECLGDEGRLIQIVTNLVDNALRHTPPGGTIMLGAHQQDGWARLTVRDTGEGIGSEHLPHVFERFYRADKTRARATGGTGLGLAIVKHLTEAHGGRVTVESAPGQGSCFAVWLPLRRNTALPLAPGSTVAPRGLAAAADSAASQQPVSRPATVR
jgi:two-component system, OmpR family, sensor kinase